MMRACWVVGETLRRQETLVLCIEDKIPTPQSTPSVMIAISLTEFNVIQQSGGALNSVCVSIAGRSGGLVRRREQGV
jgi:hypothetical protein